MRLQKIHSLFVMCLLVSSLLSGIACRDTYGLTVEEEKQMGKKILLELDKRLEIIRDPIETEFLDTIGQSLVAEVGPTPYQFRFYFIKGQEPNAFAIPGGYIFVTTGLVIMAQNVDEVAGVLSHEIAHVTMRHHSQMIDRSKRLSIASLAGMIAGVLLGGGGAASEAAAATAMATGEALMLKYSRENERDADQNSLRYLVKAGYDPQGLVSFLTKIYKYSLTAGTKVPTYLNTHPATEDRISLLETLIRMEPEKPSSLRRTANFKRIQTRAFVDEREPHVAVAFFESILKSNPEDVDGLIGLGLAFQKGGRLDRSIESFQKASVLLPNDPDLLRDLGMTYFLSGRLDPAIETLDRARSLSGAGESVRQRDPMIPYYLGRAYQEKGEFPKALALLRSAQKEMPEFAEVYLNIGSVYGRMGNKGLSHFYFAKHFKLRGDRNNALLHFKTALTWLERRSPEWEEAEREIRDLSRPK